MLKYTCLFLFTLLLVISGCKNKNPYFVSDTFLEKPEANSYQYQHNVFFKWREFDIFSRRLQISTDTSFSPMLLDTVCDTNFITIADPGLFIMSKRYYWRIYAEPFAGNGIETTPQAFYVIDSRDSIKGVYPTSILHYKQWDISNGINIDTTYTASVTISKVNQEEIKVQCTTLGVLPYLSPHIDNNPFHYGNDGSIVSPYQKCLYDTVLHKIELEFYSGDNMAGHDYLISITK